MFIRMNCSLSWSSSCQRLWIYVSYCPFSTCLVCCKLWRPSVRSTISSAMKIINISKMSYIHTNYRYIHKYIRGSCNKFPDFFCTGKIVVDSWKVSILLLYILLDDWPIFMISASNEQLQQQLEYTLLKPDCHSWWISKMQSGSWGRTICNKSIF